MKKKIYTFILIGKKITFYINKESLFIVITSQPCVSLVEIHGHHPIAMH